MSNTHALRQFLTDAHKLGYTLDGYNGEGHPRLRHPNGTVIAVARTPSDYRGRRNELARLERLAGQKLPRPNAAHYSQQRQPTNNLTTKSPSEKARAARIDQLLNHATALRQQWDDITTTPTGRNTVAAARKILSAYETVRTELAAHHRHIPPITGTPQ